MIGKNSPHYLFSNWSLWGAKLCRVKWCSDNHGWSFYSVCNRVLLRMKYSFLKLNGHMFILTFEFGEFMMAAMIFPLSLLAGGRDILHRATHSADIVSSYSWSSMFITACLVFPQNLLANYASRYCLHLSLYATSFPHTSVCCWRQPLS